MTPKLSVSQFITLFNQTVQMMIPEVIVTGELANFRVSKGIWVYFDLKDETSSLKFFGSVKSLPGPLENGMNLEVSGTPNLHNLYGFSVSFRSIKVSGVGSIARAQAMLAKKLESEGLFNPERRRPLPYPPARIALISSVESAGYSDFIKIINARWGNIAIEVIDCLVQGDSAPLQLTDAINQANLLADPPEVLVLVRGGGSGDDLAAFSDERLVRAVSASRIPTLVAIGHERDISLAELAADQRASTPSNAAELLVPDQLHEQSNLDQSSKNINQNIRRLVEQARQDILETQDYIKQNLSTKVDQEQRYLGQFESLLNAINPKRPLAKGYALVRNISINQVRSVRNVKIEDAITVELKDGMISGRVERINEFKNI